MNTSRVSAIDRLGSLPDVFDLQLFHLATNIDKASAKVMLSRWASKGYIELAGPRAGIYFKRLGSTMDRSEQVLSAVRLFYPSATWCGASVLHRAGWATQIPRQMHIAIEARPSLVQLNDVVFYERNLDWFKAVHEASGFEKQPPAAGAIRSLKPEWALADMQVHQDGWVPDEDDLDLPDGAGAKVALAIETLEALSAPAEQRRRSSPRG